MSSNQTEEKSLNLFDVFNLGFGGAIGSGIFVILGSGIAITGRSIVLVVAAGVFFMLLAYFYNVLLASMFELDGGDYSQKAIVFNPLFTGVGAYAYFTQGFALGMYGLAIVDYASVILPSLAQYDHLLAIIIVTLMFSVTLGGSKFLSLINNIMSLTLIASVILFVVFGIGQIQAGYFEPQEFFLNGFRGFIMAVSVMGWACQGTTRGPISVQAVTKDSKRVIPKAILYVCIALAITYGLVAYIAAGVLPIEQVANQNLSLVAEQILPTWVYIFFILGGAVCAIATSMLSYIQMVRYPVMKVADDGWLPAICKQTTKSGYPWVVYLIYYVMSIGPLLLGFSLDVIVSLVMIPVMMMNVYLNLACIQVIKDYPDQWQKSSLYMPTWLINAICIVAAICAGIVLYNLFIALNTLEMITMGVILAMMFGLSYYNLQVGNVSIAHLDDQKDQIVHQAIAAERHEVFSEMI